MGRKSKKIKIPKNRDIEEFVEQSESAEKIDTMEQIIEMMDKKRQEFKKNLEVKREEIEVEKEEIDEEQIEKRVKNFSNRRDTQNAEYKRKVAYHKAMDKVEELNNEDETEIQEFFDDIQRRTDEYLRKQDEEKRIKQNQKYGEKYNIQSKKQKKIKKNMKKESTEKKISGTSMKEILNSQEFKDMWEESQEER